MSDVCGISLDSAVMCIDHKETRQDNVFRKLHKPHHAKILTQCNLSLYKMNSDFVIGKWLKSEVI